MTERAPLTPHRPPAALLPTAQPRASSARTGAVLDDEVATRAAGAVLARAVAGGDAVALIGDLGAGKTTFVSGFVEALGGGPAASPTFSLINEYRGGRLVVWHVDLYRLERAAELEELGLEEIIGAAAGVACVEWADRFGVMPRDHLRVELIHHGARRLLVATGTGARGTALADELLGFLL